MGQPLTAAVRFLSGEREPVRVATTANIVLSGLQVVDNVELEVGDRVLVKDQADATENGIRLASEGEWFRAPDASYTRAIEKGVTVTVREGTVNNGRDYRFTSESPRISTDAITLLWSGPQAAQAAAEAAADRAEEAAQTVVGAVNILSAYVDFQSEFNITGNGITDDTPGFLALAAHAATDNSKVFRGRRGATYLVNSAANLALPAGTRFEMLNSRFLRGASLSGSNRIFTFAADAAMEDTLNIELDEGVVYQRLVRLTDGCFMPEIILSAATRNQVVASPNDHAFSWVGETGTESMRYAGYGELRASNIDVLTQFYRPAAGGSTEETYDPTPAEDIKIGWARTEKCGMPVWLRNCKNVSIEDPQNIGALEGGVTSADQYVVLMEGVQDIYIKHGKGVENLTHLCRNSGRRTVNEISDRNVNIGDWMGIRGHRTVVKSQPGLTGERVSSLSVGNIIAQDMGYEPNEGDGTFGPDPESNEEIVRLDCIDGAHVQSINGRAVDRPYSCYDGLVIADSTAVNVESYDVENPYRHHIAFLSYTQGGLDPGPVNDCRIGYARGYRRQSYVENGGTVAANLDADVLIDCVGQEFSNNHIDHFEFTGGTDVFKVSIDNAPTRSTFKGKAVLFSAKPINFINGSNWRARQNLIFEDAGRGTPTGIALNSYLGYAPRGAGPFVAEGLALGHVRNSNGSGATNSLSRVTGKTSSYALEWDRTVAGSAASRVEMRIPGPRDIAGKWVNLVFTATSVDASNRVGAYVQINYGTGGSASSSSTAVFCLLTQTPQEFCIPFFMPVDTALTYGAGNRIVIVFQRGSGDPNGKIVIERVDLYQTPFAPAFIEKGNMDYAVAAAIAEI